MEIIGYGILLAVGFYLAPMIIGLCIIIIAGIASLFTKNHS